MSELKPCPFCGCTNITITITFLAFLRVFCCGARIGSVKDNGAYKTLRMSRAMHERKATDAWNRRADNASD